MYFSSLFSGICLTYKNWFLFPHIFKYYALYSTLIFFHWEMRERYIVLAEVEQLHLPDAKFHAARSKFQNVTYWHFEISETFYKCHGVSGSYREVIERNTKQKDFVVAFVHLCILLALNIRIYFASFFLFRHIALRASFFSKTWTSRIVEINFFSKPSEKCLQFLKTLSLSLPALVMF